MKLKKKNKGFSLVELIVVMAIMAILAVTLAPTLTKYVEKSRKAADREVISSIYTAAQYALLDEQLNTAAMTFLSSGLSLNATPITGTPTADIPKAESGNTEMYIVDDKKWTTNNGTTGTPYVSKDNDFIEEIYNVVGNFKLKSNAAKEDTDIVITYTSDKVLSVVLQYDGSTADYTLSSNDVR